jgi:glucose-1-phosphate thymidylyltransferase
MEYLHRGELKVELLGRGFAWLDTGTHESLQQASSYVKALQDRQGLNIACVEEIAFRLGYIDADTLKNLATEMLKNNYGKYLMGILEEEGKD